MRRIDLSMELTDGEIQRPEDRGKMMGFKTLETTLKAALVFGIHAITGEDIPAKDPLTLLADDV